MRACGRWTAHLPIRNMLAVGTQECLTRCSAGATARPRVTLRSSSSGELAVSSSAARDMSSSALDPCQPPQRSMISASILVAGCISARQALGMRCVLPAVHRTKEAASLPQHPRTTDVHAVPPC
jgi:hypothetical protein